MPYSEVTNVWSGFSGAPGYTKFRFLGSATTTTADSMIAKSRTFFAALSTYLPNGVSVLANRAVDLFDDDHQKTGTVQAATNPTAVLGSATAGAYNSAAGAWINWLTDTFSTGRRVTGRTFIVPTAPASSWQSDGTLVAGFQAALVAAGTTLLTGSPVLIIPWKRDAGGGATLLGTATVVACTSTDKGGVLRSRR